MGWDWDKVVPMKPGGDAGIYAPLQGVRAYWEGLRQPPLLPHRHEIDPRGLESALEYTFMVERVAPGVARFRLAGSHLTLLAGAEVRGMPLTALLEPTARDDAMALTEKLFDEPAIIGLALEAERGMGKPALEGRMILLPVLGDDSICDRALGCLVTHGKIGRSPRRFAISHRRSEGVGPMPPRTKAAPAMRLEPGFADSARRFTAQTETAARQGRPHLRLVKSDD